jgi:hypothetical protein
VEQHPVSDDGYVVVSGAEGTTSMLSGDEGAGGGGVNYAAPPNITIGE